MSEAPFYQALNALPPPLQPAVLQHWQAWQSAAAAVAATYPAAPLLASLPLVWAGSEFVAAACIREPMLLGELSSAAIWERGTRDYSAHLESQLTALNTEEQLGVALRQLRRREMVRIAWRDLAGWAELPETLADLSALAEALVNAAVERLHLWQSQRYGQPSAADGQAQRLVILGMGKLGGGELNFSSDIDLIFTYPRQGQTAGARPISNEEFFRRLGQRLTKLLAEATAEGWVFRVDLRLRPFGEVGPLALPFAAFEDYYQTHGRDWERYALIKARVIAGHDGAGEQLLSRLQPFIYRRYLDYHAFAALRAMKALIGEEVQRKGMQRNIKLGPGGIREVEFIGQVFQLIYGGRDPVLRQRSILAVLDHLAASKRLPASAVHGLKAAYVFLRRTENRLQMWADQQTHDLPQDELGKLRLAVTMGYTNWSGFVAALAQHAALVSAQFALIFGAVEQAPSAAGWIGLCQGLLDEATATAYLQERGFAEPAQAWQRLRALRRGFNYRTMSAQGRERLDALLPSLLETVASTAQPSATLERVLNLLESIARRSVYLALLSDQPPALAQLVKLCAASPWIAQRLTRYPLLLDDLLNPALLYAPLDGAQLATELQQQLQRIPADDDEEILSVLRHFKQTQVLRVAAADVSGAMPLMIVSDHLTAIAEVLLRKILQLAYADLVPRFGEPRCVVNGVERVAQLAIVAYGKLGGIELGYASDLDLVFLHDSAGEQQQTLGAKSVDNGTFFTKLVQRILHYLTTRTAVGDLYEVDTRLRPSGRAGLLVSSCAAFADYQQQQAWTWEHQALVRARVVAGSPALAEHFAQIRALVLQVPRDREALRHEVRSMRERMRAELDRSDNERIDLKHGRGGITDIEFVVQYAVLSNAAHHPQLLTYTDNIRQIDGLEQGGIFSAADANNLRDAYRSLRRHLHLLKLQEQPARLPCALVQNECANVRHIWQSYMEAAL